MAFIKEGVVLFALMLALATTLQTLTASAPQEVQLVHAKAGDAVPSAIVDIVESDGKEYLFSEGKDIGEILRSHKRAVVFAVPGAFTPTCSSKHLPGFVQKAADLEKQGVDAIYCVSVNDKFVMRAWAQATEGALQASNLKMVADGNGAFTKAMGMMNDRTVARMGIRSLRYAAVIEDGVIVSLVVDDKGLDRSAAEEVLGGLVSTCQSS